MGVQYHLETFSRIVRSLSDSVDRVVISFIDMYSRVEEQTSHCGILEPQEATVAEVSKGISQIAESNGLTIQSCAEKKPLEKYGIMPGACIDPEMVSRAGGKILGGGKDPVQRKLCKCIKSRDIGVYNTCLFGCRYCYATKN